MPRGWHSKTVVQQIVALPVFWRIYLYGWKASRKAMGYGGGLLLVNRAKMDNLEGPITGRVQKGR